MNNMQLNRVEYRLHMLTTILIATHCKSSSSCDLFTKQSKHKWTIAV